MSKKLKNLETSIGTSLPMTLKQDNYFIVDRIAIYNNGIVDFSGHVDCVDLMSEYEDESTEMTHYKINFSINNKNDDSNNLSIFDKNLNLEILLDINQDHHISVNKLNEISSIVKNYVFNKNQYSQLN